RAHDAHVWEQAAALGGEVGVDGRGGAWVPVLDCSDQVGSLADSTLPVAHHDRVREAAPSICWGRPEGPETSPEPLLALYLFAMAIITAMSRTVKKTRGSMTHPPSV